MMAAIGTGNIENGVVTASLGTSGTIFAFSDTPVADPEGELASFCSSTGGWLPLVCTMNVTVATELVRDLLGLSVNEMNSQAQAAPPGSEGIILVPYFNGERTPALPRGRGTYFGLTPMNMTRSNICRSAMEGPAMGLRYGMNVLKKCGISPQKIRLTGGGAKSVLWRKIAADVFNCPVVSPVADEAGALGAALQAMWCRYNSKEAKTPIKSITDRFVRMDTATQCQPDRENTRVYDDLFEQYTSINAALRPLFQ
jgi:sugar (pentulose or hexulose) kinase